MRTLNKGLKELLEENNKEDKLKVLFEKSEEKITKRETQKKRCKKCGRETNDYEICLCDEYIRREELVERITLLKKYQSIRVKEDNTLEEISTISINDLINLIADI